ncbi:MAG TPA: histidine kinase, partial [Massilia sp.]|nr:histidine kinase [Massilia sp.]
MHISTSSAIENDAHERFLHMARSVQSILDSRIKSYADLLRGTSSLFLAGDEVTSEDFRRYVAGLDLENHFPGVETINFARTFSDAERPPVEEQLRRELGAQGVDFRIRPAGRRPEYTVLTYIEPSSARA